LADGSQWRSVVESPSWGWEQELFSWKKQQKQNSEDGEKHHESAAEKQDWDRGLSEMQKCLMQDYPLLTISENELWRQSNVDCNGLSIELDCELESSKTAGRLQCTVD
jgi:hypothetical protein